jgi:hypothetical protein
VPDTRGREDSGERRVGVRKIVKETKTKTKEEEEEKEEEEDEEEEEEAKKAVSPSGH